MAPSRCRRVLVGAGVVLRPLTPPRLGPWFDPASIPLERQREIATAYGAFPGYEVAHAYGIPLPWVERIARLQGVRKKAPRGYHKRRSLASRSTPAEPLATSGYVATLVVEAHLEAPSWEAAVVQLRQAGPAIRVLRVCSVQRLVAAPATAHQP